MSTIREKLWLWGHNAGSHDNCGLPRPSIMSPFEGAMYMGIPNMCRVVYGNKPEPPFDRDARALDYLDSVVWSIVGDAGSKRNDAAGSDSAEVGRTARDHKNIIGGIMDDFLNPVRRSIYSPDALDNFKAEMTREAGRPMQLWTVIYGHELDDGVIPYLDRCDAASLWIWCANAEMDKLETNFARLRVLFGDKKPILGGCYLWNYGEGGTPMPMDKLTRQLAVYLEWLKAGTLAGVIFCSNNVCDLGLEAVEYVRSWIKVNGDTEIK